MPNSKKKILILITDGVSLRNFAYTSFYKKGLENNYDVVFWNNTPFNLSDLGINHIPLTNSRLHKYTTILKNVRKRVELNCYRKRFDDTIYSKYSFPLPINNFKNIIKSIITKILIILFNSEKGLTFIRNQINRLESSTGYYQSCKTLLESHKPDIVYSTSQRSALAIAPILASKALNIPTIGFVYSWDNVPKATLDVVTDFYHVWSNYMKGELLKYQLFVKNKQVTVTGTPQFEPHFNNDEILSKEELFKTYSLDFGKTYLCYSGDDVTTSPKDPLYLRDVALAIRKLNTEGHNLGLIFRRCPVDISNRYDSVINEFKDIITPIEPIWRTEGQVWNTILPTVEDSVLLASLAVYSDIVINLGSSMVFDFAIHGKPCMFMNYNYFNTEEKPEEGVYVYDYVHFRSKPSEDAVVWLNHPNEISEKIENLLNDSGKTISAAKAWFNVINKQPANLASSSIWKEINAINK
ncbi:UDP-glycosyltransferase [uncultured Algibacter sp.]|uniref:UDP-glycosyltransferase n=1 Tax=uncultured Algibacter sp. TaxID=298659 RepID=UPI00260A8F15|nr:UDP-glycosyltransferase [uncultured Algibacter sp.]